MPQIVVMTDVPSKPGSEVVYRERIDSSDFESQHFSTQFAERVGWAVRDADLRVRESEKREGSG
jgi:hypothetical protein